MVNNLSQGSSMTPGCFVAALNKSLVVIQCSCPYTPCLYPICPEGEKQTQEGSADLLSPIVHGWPSFQPGCFLRDQVHSLVASASGSSCSCWVTSVHGVLVNPQHQAGVSSFLSSAFSPRFHPVLGQHQQVLPATCWLTPVAPAMVLAGVIGSFSWFHGILCELQQLGTLTTDTQQIVHEQRYLQRTNRPQISRNG